MRDQEDLCLIFDAIGLKLAVKIHLKQRLEAETVKLRLKVEIVKQRPSNDLIMKL